MNEFLEQFLIECRELTQLATENLLALEAAPGAKEPLDAAFRAFHTLKGAAGIVEFAAMGRALHAAEEVLAAVRAGERDTSATLIGAGLSCLDQVANWLDTIEAEDGLPVAPDAEADALIAEFARLEPARLEPARLELARLEPARLGLAPLASVPAKFAALGAPPAGTSAEPSDWLDAFLARHAASRHQARTALRYRPARDCFFHGEDPLSLIAGLPEILALEVIPARPWPVLDELDPFECNLVITVLLAAPPESAADSLRAVAAHRAGGRPDQVDIRPLAGAVLSAEAIAVLEEQLRVAAQEAPEGFPGRLGSAGQVAANVLRRAGLETAARTIVEATRRSQHDGDPAAFADAIRSVLGGPIASASAPTANGFVDTAPRAALRALRVDVERIDALVNLAGELTVAKNAIGHTTRRALDGADRDTLARALKDQYAVLDRQVGALQRSVLALRVLPMSHVFQRFPRLAREIAGDLGKSVRLLTEGETTEADKAIVEALFEPLLHVLRNAVDHGVEPEAERRAAGKPPTATIRLRAGRDGEHVIVEVADDGRGIDIANLREIAARRDIVAAGELAAMTDEAVLDLIFAPGFSTAETVTALSGRGVGMDAVRSAVARMGGQVAVKSQPGAGTSVVFTLPFTLMMLRVMTVEASGQVFGIPLSAVIETTSLPRERISRIGAGWAFVLRDHAVPVLRLSEALDLPDRSGAGTGEARVVLITVDGQTSALEVDAFGEWMDVMLKPMEGLLAGVNGLAGTTLLGDGRVLIVLDPRELPR